eukprot:CAMPEP_0114520728 /NCGR_PEP_ID=MMETSP0109-20121206/19777_1 /TAXON_ID=29199 /ORGANISM="Chlorarachnion reptans, Strain CCCM449" /LENGTH=193 /DNA_ID=CAMNT_0001701725 /DNA_START=213 /DNA_END=794 /DNA_ORIENTATION=-
MEASSTSTLPVAASSCSDTRTEPFSQEGGSMEGLPFAFETPAGDSLAPDLEKLDLCSSDRKGCWTQSASDTPEARIGDASSKSLILRGGPGRVKISRKWRGGNYNLAVARVLRSSRMLRRQRTKCRSRKLKELKYVISKFAKLATDDKKKSIKLKERDLERTLAEEMEGELVFMLRTRCSVTEPPKRFMPYIC